MSKLDLSVFLRGLDKKSLHEVAHNLFEKGASAEEVADALAALIDLALPLDLLVPGVGSLLELVDGPLIKAIALAIARGIEKGRKKRAAAG